MIDNINIKMITINGDNWIISEIESGNSFMKELAKKLNFRHINSGERKPDYKPRRKK